MKRDHAVIAANIIASGLEVMAAVLFFGAICVLWIVT